MDNQSTGKLIAAQRKALGMSQKDLAEKMNVTDKAVSKWETGKSAPDTGNLIPLANILGLSVVELLNGSRISKEEIEETTVKVVEKTIENTKKKYFKSSVKLILILIIVTAVVSCGVYGAFYWYWGRRHQILYDVDKIYLSQNEDGNFDYRITGTAKNWITNRNHLYYFCFYSDNPGLPDYQHLGYSDFLRVEKTVKTPFEIKGTLYATFNGHLTKQEAEQYVRQLSFSAVTGNPWDWENEEKDMQYIDEAELYMADYPSAELVTE